MSNISLQEIRDVITTTVGDPEENRLEVSLRDQVSCLTLASALCNRFAILITADQLFGQSFKKIVALVQSAPPI